MLIIFSSFTSQRYLHCKLVKVNCVQKDNNIVKYKKIRAKKTIVTTTKDGNYWFILRHTTQQCILLYQVQYFLK